MPAVLRLKLIDLLRVLSDKAPKEKESHTRQIKLIEPRRKERVPLNLGLKEDLEAIKAYLQNGPARRQDLEMELHYSSGVVLRRLHMLKEMGEVINLPNHGYGIKGVL
jgi:uncharacterized membrane protein